MDLRVLKRCALAAATIAIASSAASTYAQGFIGPMAEQAPDASREFASRLAVQAYWTPQRMAAALPMEKFAIVTDAAISSNRTAAPATSAPAGVPGFARGATPAMANARSPAIGAVTEFPDYTITGLAMDYGSAPSDPKLGPYGPFQRFGQAGRYTGYPISTVGKYFFTIPGAGNYVCSATAINRSTIVTAGHCVAAGDNATFYTNRLFCPSYSSGADPTFGCWGVAYAVSSGPWFTSGNPNYDYACLVMNTAGTVQANKLGNVTGWAGRAWNWPTKMLEISMGYPQAAPFDGNHIEVVAAPDWYSFDWGVSTGGVGASKFMANDLTGGSSGGPWLLGYQSQALGTEYSDVDGNVNTDPGSFWVNGVNSHKRCRTNCSSPPTSTTGVFWDEMSSPRFTSTPNDLSDSEDVFNVCFADARNN